MDLSRFFAFLFFLSFVFDAILFHPFFSGKPSCLFFPIPTSFFPPIHLFVPVSLSLLDHWKTRRKKKLCVLSWCSFIFDPQHFGLGICCWWFYVCLLLLVSVESLKADLSFFDSLFWEAKPPFNHKSYALSQVVWLLFVWGVVAGTLSG